MTKAKSSTVETLYRAPIILFGMDSRGKPKAARFGTDHANLAVKAASQLQLQVLANDNPRIGEIAARLPVGRVHATGRAFVPFIRRDLYDKLIAALEWKKPTAGTRFGNGICKWIGAETKRIRAEFARELGQDRHRRYRYCTGKPGGRLVCCHRH